jgi:hypothetical protein
MIHLSLAWSIFIYLTIFLAGILSLWIGYEMLRKQLSSAAASDRSSCRICGGSFNDSLSNNETMLQCACCGHLHERNHQGGF